MPNRVVGGADIPWVTPVIGPSGEMMQVVGFSGSDEMGLIPVAHGANAQPDQFFRDGVFVYQGNEYGDRLARIPVVPAALVNVAHDIVLHSATSESCSPSWLNQALEDLEPRQVFADGTCWQLAAPVPETQLDHESYFFVRPLLEECMALLDGPMRGYSVENVRKEIFETQSNDTGNARRTSRKRGNILLEPQHFRAMVEPYLNARLAERSKRPDFVPLRMDRFVGPDPHFDIAIQWSDHLLNQEIGTSLDNALLSFMQKHPWVHQQFVGGFDRSQAERLQRIYKFIPPWPSGRMAEDVISYSNPYPSAFASHPQAKERALHYLREIRCCAEEPGWSRVLEEGMKLRGLEGFFENSFLNDISHGFANKFVLFKHLAFTGGFRGDQMLTIQKPGTVSETSPGTQRVADKLRRVLGMSVMALEADEAPDNTALERIATESLHQMAARIVQQGGGTLLVQHVGIKTLTAIRDIKAKNPALKIGFMSHTSSEVAQYVTDGRLDVSLPFALTPVASSQAKIEDEEVRMPANIQDMLRSHAKACKDAFWSYRTHLVFGFGKIMGPAVINGLLGQREIKGDIALFDIAPTARETARAYAIDMQRNCDPGPRFEVIEPAGAVELTTDESRVNWLAQWANSNPSMSHLAIHCCGNGEKTVTIEQLMQLFENVEGECSAHIFNYQSGTAGPPVHEIQLLASDRESVYGKYGKADTGAYETFEYTIERPGKDDLKVVLRNDGWVANFGSETPEVLQDAAAHLSLSLIDGLAQASAFESLGWTGARPYDSTRLYLTPTKQRIWVCGEPGKTIEFPTTVEELLAQNPSLQQAVENSPHQPYFWCGMGNFRWDAWLEKMRGQSLA